MGLSLASGSSVFRSIEMSLRLGCTKTPALLCQLFELFPFCKPYEEHASRKLLRKSFESIEEISLTLSNPAPSGSDQRTVSTRFVQSTCRGQIIILIEQNELLTDKTQSIKSQYWQIAPKFWSAVRFCKKNQVRGLFLRIGIFGKILKMEYGVSSSPRAPSWVYDSESGISDEIYTSHGQPPRYFFENQAESLNTPNPYQEELRDMAENREMVSSPFLGDFSFQTVSLDSVLDSPPELAAASPEAAQEEEEIPSPMFELLTPNKGVFSPEKRDDEKMREDTT